VAESPDRADASGGLLGRFAPRIRTLPARVPLTRHDLLVPEFLLHQDGALAVYYAPFDHVNERARVVVVGITPGWAQMEVSFRQARADLLAGRPLPEVAERAKYAASFAGSMRANLVAMLDGIGVPAALGIGSAAALFGAQRSLLHPTSVVRYPVLVGGAAANYTGHAPRLLRHPLLGRYAFGPFADELRRRAAPDGGRAGRPARPRGERGPRGAARRRRAPRRAVPPGVPAPIGRQRPPAAGVRGGAGDARPPGAVMGGGPPRVTPTSRWAAVGRGGAWTPEAHRPAALPQRPERDAVATGGSPVPARSLAALDRSP
jgi:hypothetical protein